jgi:hypothetical protein
LRDKREILAFKEEKIRHHEYEFKRNKDKHVELITQALFPFANVKYSYEKGFYSQSGTD